MAVIAAISVTVTLLLAPGLRSGARTTPVASTGPRNLTGPRPGIRLPTSPPGRLGFAGFVQQVAQLADGGGQSGSSGALPRRSPLANVWQSAVCADHCPAGRRRPVGAALVDGRHELAE
ncbi:MAG: hypothetical protein WB800_36220, partial [Streptosporangiaceae bacterium]